MIRRDAILSGTPQETVEQKITDHRIVRRFGKRDILMWLLPFELGGARYRGGNATSGSGINLINI